MCLSCEALADPHSQLSILPSISLSSMELTMWLGTYLLQWLPDPKRAGASSFQFCIPAPYTVVGAQKMKKRIWCSGKVPEPGLNDYVRQASWLMILDKRPNSFEPQFPHLTSKKNNPLSPFHTSQFFHVTNEIRYLAEQVFRKKIWGDTGPAHSFYRW